MLLQLQVQKAFLLLFLLTATLAHAQPVQYGDDLTGTFSSYGEIHQYTFSGTTGDIIRIRMRGTSGGVDGCIALLDPSGNSIAEDCDDGGIVTIDTALPVTGTFIINAKDYNDNDLGDYGISLQILNNSVYSQPIDCGADISTALDNWAEMDAYSFSGKAGDKVLIQMRSELSNIESRLELFASSGEKLADGTTQVGLTSIADLALPADGTYLILATDGNGNDKGNYGLSLQILNDITCATEVSCGANFTTTIGSYAEMDAFYFHAEQGNKIILQMLDLEPSLEPHLTLYDPAGNLIASDIPADGIAKINMFNIPADGDYLFIVKDDKGNDTGDFSVSLQIMNNSLCTEQLTCGSFASSLSGAAEVDLYTFSGTVGEVVNIQMRGLLSDIDPLLKVYDSYGNILAENYINGSLTSIKNLLLPTDGTYLVSAEDRGGNDIGDYGFSFQKVNADCSEVLSCEEGSIVASIDFFAEMDKFSFYGEAGQVLNLEMAEIDAVLEPMMALYDPAGNLLREEATSLHVDFTGFTLPTTGTYVVLTMDKNGNDTGAYTVNFTLNDANGASVCHTCDDGIMNGLETAVDCGGPDCQPCCAAAGTSCNDNNPATFDDVEDGNCNCAGSPCQPVGVVCNICPADITISCSDLSTPGGVSGPQPTSIIGAGTYDLTIQLDGPSEASPGNCLYNTITFDTGCKGIRTACWGNTLKFTPDYLTCQGAFPALPFTIDFGGGMVVSFDQQGTPTVSGAAANVISSTPVIDEWLNTGNSSLCSFISITNDFDENIFAQACSSMGSVSQEVHFMAEDICGLTYECSATITVVDDLTPCPAAGTPCDDADATTSNDVEDGNCNCAGTPAPDACDALQLAAYTINSFANGQDQGVGQLVENNEAFYLANNAWKSIAFNYTITPQTMLEFEFKSTIEGENHGIGFDNDNNQSSGRSFMLHGFQSWGITDYNTYSGNGDYQKFVIPVGTFFTGNFDRLVFFADHDRNPKNGNSFFKNIRVYEDGACDEALAGCGSGTISRDVWTNVQGYPISNVPWNTHPNISDELDIFEIPADVMDLYGTRLRGTICPPQSGLYTFWIASDDMGELWLSTDEDPTNISRIAEVPGWTNSRQWDKYPEQKSVKIYLEQGRQYYVEAYQKEYLGLDNLAVGWELPDGTLERPIGGAHLSPWNGSGGSAFNSQPLVADFGVFPNPAQEQLNVDARAFLQQTVEVALYNNFGKVIYRKSYEKLSMPVITVDIEKLKLQSGYYSISVFTKDQFIVKPFVVSDLR